MKLLDLTQTISKGIPDWDGSCGFQMKNSSGYESGLCVQEIQTPNGIGTHMDAPSHFFEGESDIASISIEKLVCPGVVINVSEKLAENCVIEKEDIINFEKRYGAIPKNSIVIGYTGWCHYWSNPKQYRNEDTNGIMRFPTFSLESIDYLLTKQISGIAIDTLSPDGDDYTFPVHRRLLGEGKFIIENIKIIRRLPPNNFTLFALPMKIKGATESPCRVIAYIDS